MAAKERTLTIVFWLVVVFLAWFFLLWASLVPAQEIPARESSQGQTGGKGEEMTTKKDGQGEEGKDSERGIIEAKVHCRWLGKVVPVEQVTFNSKREGRRLFLRVAINQFEGGADQANEFLQDYFRSANKHPECDGLPQCQMMISMIHLDGYAHLDVDKSYLTLPDGTKDYLKEEELFRLALTPPDGQDASQEQNVHPAQKQ